MKTMQQFDANTIATTITQLTQLLVPSLFYKWVIVLILLGYAIFQFIIFRQIQSMEKIITQPRSSTILSAISIILLIASIAIIVFTISIRI